MTGSYLVRVIFHALVQVESPGSGRLTKLKSTRSFTKSTTVDSFAGAHTPKPAVSGRLEAVWRDKKISTTHIHDLKGVALRVYSNSRPPANRIVHPHPLLHPIDNRRINNCPIRLRASAWTDSQLPGYWARS